MTAPLRKFVPLFVLFTATPILAQHFEKVLVPVYAPSGLQGAGASFYTTLTAVSPSECSYSGGKEILGLVGPNQEEVQIDRNSVRIGRFVFIDSSCSAAVSFGLTVHSWVDQNRVSVNNLPVVRERHARTTAVQLMNVPISFVNPKPFFEPPIPSYRYRLVVYNFDDRSDGRVDVNYYIPFGLPGGNVPSARYSLTLDRREGSDPSFPYFGELSLPAICLGVSSCQYWNARVEIIPRSSSLRYWAIATSTNNTTQQIVTSIPQE